MSLAQGAHRRGQGERKKKKNHEKKEGSDSYHWLQAALGVGTSHRSTTAAL